MVNENGLTLLCKILNNAVFLARVAAYTFSG